MRPSGPGIGLDIGFEHGWSVGMVLVAPVVSPLENSISMLLGLALVISFGSWEVSFIGVSLGTLVVLMNVTGKGFFFGLKLGLRLGLSPESPNTGIVIVSLFVSLTGMILGESLVNTLGYLLYSIWYIKWRVP